jgi:hypothetical protein
MAGLAAVTSKIKLFTSTAILMLPLAAQMAMAIESIAPGCFRINIVTGWQMAYVTSLLAQEILILTSFVENMVKRASDLEMPTLAIDTIARPST